MSNTLSEWHQCIEALSRYVVKSTPNLGGERVFFFVDPREAGLLVLRLLNMSWSTRRLGNNPFNCSMPSQTTKFS